MFRVLMVTGGMYVAFDCLLSMFQDIMNNILSKKSKLKILKIILKS